ncbi:MAG: hypothetical protein RLZZ337_1047 [Bacteroidota bacterium]|jgi:hypothetical protein
MEDVGIINRVEQSGIVTLNLEELIPNNNLLSLDIKDQLFQGLILREKDFRAWVKENDWSIYKNASVAVHCSADAIVPTWAYMLIASSLQPYASDVFFCEPAQLPALLSEKYLNKIDANEFTDKRVVIKGCGDREISNHAYLKLTTMLVPFVKSLMFGEPCSTVPVYKKR